VTALAFFLVHMGMLLIDPQVAFTVAQILIQGLAPWQLFAVALGIIAFWLLIRVSILGPIRTKLIKAENTSFQRVH